MSNESAPIQITAEQILLEAFERQADIYFRPLQEQITDEVDLADYLVRRRREFEANVGRSPNKSKPWIEYASWELAMQDHRRMRSIMERALCTLYTEPKLWLAYAELELKGGNLEEALEVFSRATCTLPRIDKLWIIYLDVLRRSNQPYESQHAVYNKWMSWHPPNSAYIAFADFEFRMNNVDNVWKVLEQMISTRPKAQSFRDAMSFAKHRVQDLKQSIYFAQVFIQGFLDQALADVTIFLELSSLYVEIGSLDEARSAFKFAIDNVATKDKSKVGKEWLFIERKYGDPSDIQTVALLSRKYFCLYRTEIKPNDVNNWFDLIKILQELSSPKDEVVSVFERAIKVEIDSTSPTFQRLVYLWIMYASYLEVVIEDAEGAKEVYSRALEELPLGLVKVPMLAKSIALFYVRLSDLEGCRKVLNWILTKLFDPVLFKFVIDLENSLGNVDYCKEFYNDWKTKLPEMFS
ncbi:hypothetical protein GEMRC1_002577 [Eukaryota sp. GEM-RC1]